MDDNYSLKNEIEYSNILIEIESIRYEKSTELFRLAFSLVRNSNQWKNIFQKTDENYWKTLKKGYLLKGNIKTLKRVYNTGKTFQDLLLNPEKRKLYFSCYEAIANCELSLEHKMEIRQKAENEKMNIYKIKKLIKRYKK